jgi:hypothetical protein
MTASLDVSILVKAFSLLFSWPDSGCSGGKPRSRVPGSDDGCALCFLSLLRESFLEQISTGAGATLGITLDPVLPDQTMVTRGTILP